jgi:H+-transporting ATPase
VFGAKDAEEMILMGSLASKSEDRDAIDMAVISGLRDSKTLDAYTQLKFIPFDPVHKRTEAEIKGPSGGSFKVTKGAPQVVLALCRVEGVLVDRINARVDEFAAQGFRTLGVARSDSEGVWQFLGLLPLFDPPREDSAETIQHAGEHGISVKMVTGDNLAIARQIASRLGLGKDIHVADEFFSEGDEQRTVSPQEALQVEAADGFAQVFPEHKFEIVKTLQSLGHIVGMTGDGVNDAPALKQANTGIAVSGATDAARSAAALVLTAPGLSVIVRAVEEARTIFERMNSYAIYRITETIRIMFFVVMAMIVFNFYPITTIMIILLALLNDLPIMTIAYDNTWLDPKPVRWEMRRVLSIATVLGLIGVVETFGLLIIAKVLLKLDQAQIQTFIYLKLAVAGHLTLFVARTRRPFLTKPYPAPVLLIAILGTQAVAALIAGFGILVAPIPWSYVGLVWAYCLAWVFIEDWAKLHVYDHLALSGKRHSVFLDLIKSPLHYHGATTTRWAKRRSTGLQS